MEQLQAKRDVEADERAMHARVKWFTEKWTAAMDLNKRDAAEFSADLIMVVQAIHRDANRTTHDLLMKALAAAPMPAVLIPEKNPLQDAIDTARGGPAPTPKTGYA